MSSITLQQTRSKERSRSTAIVSTQVYLAALSVAALTFPLIWVGGLVTTHDAGMAVPDWPGTFGYNMFLYPISTWIYGPFDLLVEHGHRLLASVVGFLGIVLCFVATKHEQRSWVRRACWILLLAIIGQGILGGVRVLLDARVVALIHGCCGPLVFALASWIVMVNSTHWQSAETCNHSRLFRWACLVLFLLTILQLVLGAHLRHALPQWVPTLFLSVVHTHLLMATIITLLILAVAVSVLFGKSQGSSFLRWPALCLVGLVIAQVLLGCGTWVASYALPWQEWNEFFARYVISGRGFNESMIINGHQATGSLLIVATLWLLCRVERQARPVQEIP
jgi:heme a synthase